LYYLKYFHIACAAVSMCGFVLRGIWMLGNPVMLAKVWVRVAPHIIDTLLLLSGITMAVVLGISPFVQPWLAAKLTALVAYILLGSVALKRGRTRGIRAAALCGSVAIFAYIAAVALTHDPLVGL
jgi:uncharacterized membrane protein SirB2